MPSKQAVAGSSPVSRSTRSVMTGLTLDGDEQGRRIVEAPRIFTESAGVVFPYFNPTVIAYRASVTRISYRSADAEQTWNIHEWGVR